jgi:phage portal protein BeeE
MVFALINRCAALSGDTVALVLLIVRRQVSHLHRLLPVHVVTVQLEMEFALTKPYAAHSGDTVALDLPTADRRASLFN